MDLYNTKSESRKQYCLGYGRKIKQSWNYPKYCTKSQEKGESKDDLIEHSIHDQDIAFTDHAL